MGMKFNRLEFAGGLADIGVLLPMIATMVAVNGINPFMALLLAGLFYITTGYYYRMPVPVQPLKVFCAMAIIIQASPALITAGALLIGIMFLLLAVPPIMRRLEKLFATVIIRGIQLGTGLLLIDTGLKLITRPEVIMGGKPATLFIMNTKLSIGLLVGICCFFFFFVFLRNTRFPMSLTLIVLGFGLAIASGAALVYSPLNEHAGLLALLSQLQTADFYQALFLLVLPQIPLSLGNAIIATSNTLNVYYGDQAERATTSRLACGMGLANIAAGLLGGIPCCHGSSGATAHYKLGARTGGATVMMGLIYCGLAILAAYYGSSIFTLFPYPILGVLLIYVGIEHSLLIHDVKRQADLAIVIIIAAIAFVSKNMTVAFIVGMVFREIVVRRRLFVAASDKN